MRVADPRAAPGATPRGSTRMPPSPWIGSISTAAVSGPITASTAARSSNGTWSKPGSDRPEALDHLLRSRRGDRRRRAAVERALESDDADAVRLAAVVEVLARHLDRALDRLGAGVGDEDRVGEGRRDQTLRQRLLVGDLVEVRGVPELARLRLERGHQRRVGVAKGGHRDAAAEVQVSFTPASVSQGPSPETKASGARA